jgi:uncharacterized protein YjcR
MALEMYLEGLNYRIIGNLLQVSYGTVYQWIRKWGKQAELPRRNAPAKVVELDKLHHYIGTKKYSAGGHNLLLIDMGSDSSLMSAGVKTYTKK